MVGSKCNLKMHVRNLGVPPAYKSGAISQFKGKFNRLYLRNKIQYTKAGKCAANYKESPTSSQNDMNFGPQTASNWK